MERRSRSSQINATSTASVKSKSQPLVVPRRRRIDPEHHANHDRIDQGQRRADHIARMQGRDAPGQHRECVRQREHRHERRLQVKHVAPDSEVVCTGITNPGVCEQHDRDDDERRHHVAHPADRPMPSELARADRDRLGDQEHHPDRRRDGVKMHVHAAASRAQRQIRRPERDQREPQQAREVGRAPGEIERDGSRAAGVDVRGQVVRTSRSAHLFPYSFRVGSVRGACCHADRG